MNIEDQCCDLVQAKRLKELGVGINFSCFAHVDNVAIGYEGIKMVSDIKKRHKLKDIFDSGVIRFYSAFTLAELGLMLNAPIYDWLGTYGHPLVGYHCSYIREDEMFGDEKSTCTFPHEADPSFKPTEAQARAAMLIYLLENNLVTSEQVNQKLINE